MDSCRSCFELLKLALPLRAGSHETICDYGQRRRIKQSAQSCGLCRKFYTYLLDRYGAGYDDRYTDHVMRIEVYSSKHVGEESRVSRIIFDWKFPRAGRYVDLAVWADEGTPASARLVARPPVLDNNPLEITRLVRTWLYACLSDHERCRLSMSPGPFNAEVVPLPRRLLSIIVGTGGNISVKLVQTIGTNGHYCALSYCWGSPNNHPLRTTQSNLAQHLGGIPFDKLPVTFRDALILAGGLNIGYLWIDSLCIVQDDPEEWVQEIGKMGSIYEQATLVIVAAGAKGSTERLFNVERPAPTIFHFPFPEQGLSSDHGGRFNVAIRPNDHRQPNDGPLAKRAWAMQEWYLARRKVFFMPGGITWKCKICGMNERGGDEDSDKEPPRAWLPFLEEYTKKELAFPTDRLAAILGFVNEMRKSRKDAYRFGIWDEEVHEQLIWRFVNDSSSKQPQARLPSWNWAATAGAKIWPLIRTDLLQDCQVITKLVVDVTQSACLRVSGPLVRANTSRIRPCCTQALWEKLQHFEDSERVFLPNIEEMMLPGYSDDIESDDAESFLLTGVGDSHRPLGLAVFDQFKRLSEVFCLPLISTKRQIQDPCHPKIPNSEPSSSTPEDKETQADEEANSKDLPVGDAVDDVQMIDVSHDSRHHDTDGCVDLGTVGRSEKVYWALLLQPVGDTSTTFKRVGLGLLYPAALDTISGETSNSRYEIK